jgi:hypothetical protein
VRQSERKYMHLETFSRNFCDEIFRNRCDWTSDAPK